MAVTDLAAWKDMRAYPFQTLCAQKSSLTTIAGRWSSLFLTNPFGGSAPTTAAALTKATTGSLRTRGGQEMQNSSTTQRVVSVRGQSSALGTLLLIDRLSHQGGIDSTITTVQTTNLPTAALTRYTSGEGVMAAYQIYTQVGTTATTIVSSYTDETGTAGNNSQPVVFGATAFREVGRVIPFNLASGDKGVRAVADVDLVASTGTAGAFGVVLFKPLLSIPINYVGSFDWDPLVDGGGLSPEVLTDACLDLIWIANSTASGVFEAEIALAEDR